MFEFHQTEHLCFSGNRQDSVYRGLTVYIYIYLEYAYACDFLFLYNITESCKAPEALCHGMKIGSFL